MKILLLAALVQQLPTVTPQAGMVIEHSIRLRPGTWRLAASASLEVPLITVRGDSITVDMRGVALEGRDPDVPPDEAAGVAIRVEGGRNIRLIGGRIRGYRFAIMARETRGLEISGADLSYNWKPRLFSLVEHESLVDWLSFHRNDRNEWLRFGAAIYLDGVRGGRISGNTARQGMNALLMTRSDSIRIEGNDFSFNSGLGVGMYRSSDNVIVRNVMVGNVRGYSHGHYRRGQDSAGLLMYEQSHRNVAAFNTVTHGGDGLFVWAGQTTMDSGTGGVNDNLFYGNDFSFAPTNAMEATFSRNTFVANRATGSDYGLWGGYSYESRVVANEFSGNRIGIAIEHGQSNLILGNRFSGDTTAIRLWANPTQPPDWGYPRYRDTRSRDHRIEGNFFARNRVVVRGINTSGLSVAGNRFAAVDTVLVLSDTARFTEAGNVQLPEPDGGSGAALPVPEEFARLLPGELRGDGRRPSSPLGDRDRSAIIVDEWGPFDWLSPKLWPVDSVRSVPLRLAVAGPPGRWRVVERRGIAALSALAGATGDTLAVTPSSHGDWSVTLEYRGGEVISPRGRRVPAGRPWRFSYGRFEPAGDWRVRFFAWSDSTDPRTSPAGFAGLLAGPPLLERRESRLDYMWYRPQVEGVPQERFAIEARTTISLEPGTYTLRSISDDGIRVWVDGALVIDNWTLHESMVDLAPLTGGRHEIVVHFFQVAGWTELRLDIVRGVDPSRGSAGPH
jgi:parallel beta-helix repeat protein